MKKERKTVRVDDMIEYAAHLHKQIRMTDEGPLKDMYEEDRFAVIRMINELTGIPMYDIYERT